MLNQTLLGRKRCEYVIHQHGNQSRIDRQAYNIPQAFDQSIRL